VAKAKRRNEEAPSTKTTGKVSKKVGMRRTKSSRPSFISKDGVA
jgi:hypothetical protein